MHIVHFHNGGGGGVLAVIRNLLLYRHHDGIKNHIIYTINKDQHPAFEIPKLKGAASEQVFYYSPKWNFYYTCKQLTKLLPDDKAVIVAHDWMELGMLSNLGLQNPALQFVHGNYDYYYELAKKHEQSVDRFIAVSPVIYNQLCALLPNRKNDIGYCRFPVPTLNAVTKENAVLKVFYCVRNLLDDNKQFKVLPLINKGLKKKALRVEWTIIGEGFSKDEISILMEQVDDVSSYPYLPNEEVIKLLPGHDLFILPSVHEGFPVSVVEAMKARLVPLVTNWGGATDELIAEGETGYNFEAGDVEGYSSAIALLNGDRKLLKQLARNAEKKANELFDPFVNTKNIEDAITIAYSNKKLKKAKRAYGSGLDKLWIPNSLTYFFRNL